MDGSGRDLFVADLAVKDGLVANIGSNLGPAEDTIDLAGKTLVPGFVDVHGHSELKAMTDPDVSPKLLQGYTSELAGNCGVGVAPVREEEKTSLTQEVAGILGRGPEVWNWNSFPELLDRMESGAYGVDLGLLVPHGPLRSYVMGKRRSSLASERDIVEMTAILREAMDAGAFGLSTGLFYDPCCYADSKELTALFETVASRGGVVSVHQRNEGDRILESLEEILAPAESSGVRLQISHLKVGGERNRHKLDRVLETIERYAERGCDVAFDQYPYSAGSTSLYSLLPPSYLALGFNEVKRRLGDKVERGNIRGQMEEPGDWDGVYSMLGWDRIILTGADLEENRVFLGRTLREIGDMRGQDPFDSYFDLISKEGKALTMVDFITDEDSVERIMVHPLQCFGTDGLYSGCPHPRTFGCSYRVLDRYVKGKKLLTLPEAIRKLSSLPAKRAGFDDRGLLSVGFRADMVELDLDVLEDRADYGSPSLVGLGIPSVWVRGRPAVKNGEIVSREGRLVRR
ncbi:MAG: D-aminoacylase [Synergistota bacterium]|nr:D-aminoacylase [Synergistota bacterium]